MKRVVLVAALAASAFTVAILSASGSAQAPGERTFTLITRDSEGSERFVDNSPRSRGLSAGDAFVFHQPTRNQARRRVGSVDASCTATQGGRTGRFICHGAYTLNEGAIMVEAPLNPADRVVRIAITGGTGAYEGAEGSIRSTSRPGRSVDIFHLLAD